MIVQTTLSDLGYWDFVYRDGPSPSWFARLTFCIRTDYHRSIQTTFTTYRVKG